MPEVATVANRQNGSVSASLVIKEKYLVITAGSLECTVSSLPATKNETQPETCIKTEWPKYLTLFLIMLLSIFCRSLDYDGLYLLNQQNAGNELHT